MKVEFRMIAGITGSPLNKRPHHTSNFSENFLLAPHPRDCLAVFEAGGWMDRLKECQNRSP